MEDIQSSAPELSTEVSSEDPNADSSQSANTFEVDGQRYTTDQIKQMRQAQMRHEDYTKKTQTFAQERNQWNRSAKAVNDGSLKLDLQSILDGKASVEMFKKVYHKDFHHYVDQFLNEQRNKPGQQSSFDPAFVNRFTEMEQRFNQMTVDAIDKELDVKEQEFVKKYPYADPGAAYLQAESLLDYKIQQGIKPEITTKEWDNIWKSAHDKQSERFKQYQTNLVKGQKNQNAKNRDTGPGGGIPGQAPRKAKNIKEATEMVMQHLDEF